MTEVKPGMERIKKTAKPSGNTARIYVPKNWEGDEILAINLDSSQEGDENMSDDDIVETWYSEDAEKIANEIFNEVHEEIQKLTLWKDGGITVNNEAETAQYREEESLGEFLRYVNLEILD